MPLTTRLNCLLRWDSGAKECAGERLIGSLEIYVMRYSKGSATIEMAYIGPMTVLIIMVIIYIVFFFFDKNIVIGAAAETATIGAALERREDINDEIDLEDVFIRKVDGKLVMYRNYELSVEKTGDKVFVNVTVSKGLLGFSISQGTEVTKPETIIRRTQKIKEVLGLD